MENILKIYVFLFIFFISPYILGIIKARQYKPLIENINRQERVVSTAINGMFNSKNITIILFAFYAALTICLYLTSHLIPDSIFDSLRLFFLMLLSVEAIYTIWALITPLDPDLMILTEQRLYVYSWGKWKKPKEYDLLNLTWNEHVKDAKIEILYLNIYKDNKKIVSMSYADSSKRKAFYEHFKSTYPKQPTAKK